MALLRSHGYFFLLFVIGTACAPPESSPPPEVEYAGCKAVLVPGPVCVLPPDRKIQLWVGAPPDARIEIQVDGRRFDAVSESVQDGKQFSPLLPSEARTIEVLVSGRAPWSLQVRRDLLGENAQKMRLVHTDILNSRLSAARGALDSPGLPPEAPAESRFFASYYRGVLAEREGDYRSALDEIQKALEIAERGKLEVYKRLAEEELALFLRGIGRSRESAEIFERLLQTSKTWDPRAHPCDEFRLLSNQAWSALLAREAGESFRDPTPLLERALESFDACAEADPEKKVDILLNLALAHLQEGRLPQTKDLLARAHELEPHPPVRHTLWWLDLDARTALWERRPAEALHLFGELEDLSRETSSFDGRLRAALGQARSHRVLGDQTTALETLRKAEDLLDEQSLQIPLQGGRETFVATRQAIVSLHVEILLGRGRNAQALDLARHARSRVLRQLERGDRLASLPRDRRAQWARLRVKYQERRAALEARAKDDWKLSGDQVRHERVTRRREAMKVEKLLDEAFLVFGDPAKQPREAPHPPLRPGELILAYHPLSRGRWVGFAADGKTVAAQIFELPPAIPSRPAEPKELDRLASRLLLPFRTAIRQAQRIRILASGRLQGIDFHELPFDDDVLLARAPVVYGLDLPVSTSPAQTPGRQALLVADPRSDLPGALDEAQRVRKVLESGPQPWTTRELKSAEASAEAVQGRLATTSLLHYAGHGTFSGFGGWESSLLLAEKSQLTLGDLLALDRVPAWVVLSACDAGRSSAETPVESLGLAHAFLLAGSRAVVASTRPAADREVPAFFADLYRRWDREPDLAVALQHAQLSWRKRNPKADWPSFRLFEP